MLNRICIVCKKNIGELDEESKWKWMDNDSCTSWYSSGNFGSQEVDSASTQYGVDKLIIFLCDECLKENEEFVLTLTVKKPVETKTYGSFKKLRDLERTEEVVES
jgi:hypothetical protein